MIGKGYELLKGLEHLGYDVPDTHLDIKTLAKKSYGYRVGLDKDGMPVEIEEAKLDEHWLHRDGQQNSFPVIKTQLFTMPKKLSKKKKNPTRQEIEEDVLLSRYKKVYSDLFLYKNPNDKNPEDIIENINGLYNERNSVENRYNYEKFKALRIGKVSGWLDCIKHLADQHGWPDIEDRKNPLTPYNVLRNFLERFCPFEKDFGKGLTMMFERFSRLALSKLICGELNDLGCAIRLLFGIGGKINVLFDIANVNNKWPILVSDYRVRDCFNDMLYMSEEYLDEPVGKTYLGKSALPGNDKDVVLVDARMPEPVLGALGQTKLCAKNWNSKCDISYAKVIEETYVNLFPVGKKEISKIANSYSYLVSPEFEGKNWCMVANGRWSKNGEDKDLLLVYCDAGFDGSAEWADLFGSRADQRNKSRYLVEAKAIGSIIEDVYRQIETSKPHPNMHVLVINKLDQVKGQVVMQETFKIDHLLHLFTSWRESIRSVDAGRMSFDGMTPLPVPLDRIVRLLSSKWINLGVREIKAIGPSLFQVMTALMCVHCGWEEEAAKLLDMTVDRLGSLLVRFAGTWYSCKKEENGKITRSEAKEFIKEDRDRAEAIFSGVALLIVLLDILNGRDRDKYMQSSAYVLGEICSLVDELHLLYCKHVRDGAAPPSLLGNQMMAVAAEDPVDAIDRLRDRFSIYHSWAYISELRTEKNMKLVNYLKSIMHDIGEKCEQLKPLFSNGPYEVDPEFRAKLFLGYMARMSGKKDKKEGE